MKGNYVSKMYLSKLNFNFFCQNISASFLPKNSVSTDYLTAVCLCYNISRAKKSLNHV